MKEWKINHGKGKFVGMLKLRVVKSEVAQMQCLFKDLLCGWGMEMEVMEERLSG